MATLLEGLYVDADRMRKNMDLSQGQLFSSQVLLLMIDQGLTREAAYKIVQRVCHDLEPGDSLENRLLADPEASQYVDKASLKAVFSGARQKKRIESILAQVLKGKSKGHGKNERRTAVRGKS